MTGKKLAMISTTEGTKVQKIIYIKRRKSWFSFFNVITLLKYPLHLHLPDSLYQKICQALVMISEDNLH